MKKALAAVLAAVLLVPAIAFAADDKVIKVGVTPFPHKDIMEAARPLLEKEGYELKIVEFTDYVTPNTALAEGAIDANFFQHVPYFDNANKERGLKCVWVAKIHIEPERRRNRGRLADSDTERRHQLRPRTPRP